MFLPVFEKNFNQGIKLAPLVFSPFLFWFAWVITFVWFFGNSQIHFLLLILNRQIGILQIELFPRWLLAIFSQIWRNVVLCLFFEHVRLIELVVLWKFIFFEFIVVRLVDDGFFEDDSFSPLFFSEFFSCLLEVIVFALLFLVLVGKSKLVSDKVLQLDSWGIDFIVFGPRPDHVIIKLLF